ncbi:Right handed beta helix region [Candidatus Gugararchaeum adminiculabundum]|nr:Right handed beta helix region [Candidatus Gugararchaeum adminiculabundum]
MNGQTILDFLGQRQKPLIFAGLSLAIIISLLMYLSSQYSPNHGVDSVSLFTNDVSSPPLTGVCESITGPGTYVLSNNLEATGASCILIDSDNVVFDCNGFNITGDNTAGMVGVLVNTGHSNVVIENCVISGFEYGVNIPDASNDAITNNTIYNCTKTGINTERPSSNINITYNTVYNNSRRGIDIRGQYYLVANNTAYNNTEAGIGAIESNYSILADNRVFNNSQNGMAFENSLWNNITNNTIFENANGIILFGSSFNLVAGNNVSSNTLPDTSFGGIVLIFNASGNSISANIVENNPLGIALLGASDYNNITDNEISGSLQYGIALIDFPAFSIPSESSHNNFFQNNISSDGIAIYVVNATDNNYANNTILSGNVTFFNNQTSDIYVLGNYWGTTSCDDVDAHIFDTTNYPRLGTIFFSPALDSPYPGTSTFSCPAPPPRPILPPECGDEISSSTTLDSDLSGCSENGLEITADNIILDCNGSSITSSNHAGTYGIGINGYSNVTVENCVINYFAAGFNLTGVNETVIRNNTYVGRYGWENTSSGIWARTDAPSSMYNNLFVNNRFLNVSYGISFYSSTAEIGNNSFIGNYVELTESPGGDAPNTIGLLIAGNDFTAENNTLVSLYNQSTGVFSLPLSMDLTGGSHSEGIVIRNNTMLGRENGFIFGIIAMAANNTLISNNHITGNSSINYAVSSIRPNVSMAIWISINSSNIQVTSNALSSFDYGMRIWDAAGGSSASVNNSNISILYNNISDMDVGIEVRNNSLDVTARYNNFEPKTGSVYRASLSPIAISSAEYVSSLSPVSIPAYISSFSPVSIYSGGVPVRNCTNGLGMGDDGPSPLANATSFFNDLGSGGGSSEGSYVGEACSSNDNCYSGTCDAGTCTGVDPCIHDGDYCEYNGDCCAQWSGGHDSCQSNACVDSTASSNSPAVQTINSSGEILAIADPTANYDVSCLDLSAIGGYDNTTLYWRSTFGFNSCDDILAVLPPGGVCYGFAKSVLVGNGAGADFTYNSTGFTDSFHITSGYDDPGYLNLSPTEARDCTNGYSNHGATTFFYNDPGSRDPPLEDIASDGGVFTRANTSVNYGVACVNFAGAPGGYDNTTLYFESSFDWQSCSDMEATLGMPGICYALAPNVLITNGSGNNYIFNASAFNSVFRVASSFNPTPYLNYSRAGNARECSDGFGGGTSPSEMFIGPPGGSGPDWMQSITSDGEILASVTPGEVFDVSCIDDGAGHNVTAYWDSGHGLNDCSDVIAYGPPACYGFAKGALIGNGTGNDFIFNSSAFSGALAIAPSFTSPAYINASTAITSLNLVDNNTRGASRGYISSLSPVSVGGRDCANIIVIAETIGPQYITSDGQAIAVVNSSSNFSVSCLDLTSVGGPDNATVYWDTSFFNYTRCEDITDDQGYPCHGFTSDVLVTNGEGNDYTFNAGAFNSTFNITPGSPYPLYLINMSSGDVIAINNYWGSALLGDITNSIYDNADDAANGLVHFSPFLTLPYSPTSSGPSVPGTPSAETAAGGAHRANTDTLSISVPSGICAGASFRATVGTAQKGPLGGVDVALQANGLTESTGISDTFGGVAFTQQQAGSYTVLANYGTLHAEKTFTVSDCTILPPIIPQCAADSDCLPDENCANQKCAAISGTCGHAANHAWIPYECCSDSICAAGESCTQNVCVEKQNATNPPVVPPIPPVDDAQKQAADAIGSAISSANGLQDANVQSLIDQAKAAYARKDYSTAQSLAKQAQDAAATLRNQAAQPPKPETGGSAVSAQEQAAQENNLKIAVGALIAVPILAVLGIYFYLRARKK